MNGARAQPPRGRSLRDKLTLLFFGIVAAAFAVLYFLVVPELEANLRDQKFAELARVAEGTEGSLNRLTRDPTITAQELDERIERIANAVDTRLTLFGIQQAVGRGPSGFYAISDSRVDLKVPENLPLVRRAGTSGDLALGEMRFQGEELGQVAQALVFQGEPARVALYSRSFDDVADTVAFVRNRMLIGGGIALALALFGGAVVAQTLARRVRRLEIAAEDVAAGLDVEPLRDDSEDELGELTRAFNAMQRQLRQVDIARREFVATASHELRTPIFSLGGFVELLRDDDVSEAERRDFLDEIARQVERLQKLAVDLLDLSRLDSGSVALEIDAVDVAELAEAVSKEFAPAMGEHDTDLRLRLPDHGVLARCDRERVAQILRILLDNVLRHTPPGTVLRIVAGSDSAGAAIAISDDGPGLPADKPVFDRFVTGGESRGAGLGLPIARELAERMGGSLRADGDGGGTVFTLRLPEVGR